MTLNEAHSIISEPLEHESEGASVDAFHNGDFKVLQPTSSGHRSGLDALLLAASVPADASGILADFGAGAGVAGFAALNLNKELDLISVELNQEMAGLASRSLQLEGNETLKTRAKIIKADITANGTERLKSGLEPDSVSHGIMNPPYNKSRYRPPADMMKAEAYMLGEGGIDAWFRTAAAMIKPGGTLTMIYRTEDLGDILACAQGRFGGLEILPVHSHKDEAAKRLIVRGTRGSRAPMMIVPGFVVHQDNGSFTTEAQTVLAGESRIRFAG
ncbi:MAG: methyltransferase [Pseudomonadota bacterium]